jgi:hypothetical protein
LSLSFTFLLQNPVFLHFHPPTYHLTHLFLFDLISRIFFRDFTSLKPVLWSSFLVVIYFLLLKLPCLPIFEHNQSCMSLNFGDQCSRQCI